MCLLANPAGEALEHSLIFAVTACACRAPSFRTMCTLAIAATAFLTAHCMHGKVSLADQMPPNVTWCRAPSARCARWPRRQRSAARRSRCWARRWSWRATWCVMQRSALAACPDAACKSTTCTLQRSGCGGSAAADQRPRRLDPIIHRHPSAFDAAAPGACLPACRSTRRYPQQSRSSCAPRWPASLVGGWVGGCLGASTLRCAAHCPPRHQHGRGLSQQINERKSTIQTRLNQSLQGGQSQGGGGGGDSIEVFLYGALFSNSSTSAANQPIRHNHGLSNLQTRSSSTMWTSSTTSWGGRPAERRPEGCPRQAR